MAGEARAKIRRLETIIKGTKFFGFFEFVKLVGLLSWIGLLSFMLISFFVLAKYGLNIKNYFYAKNQRQ